MSGLATFLSYIFLMSLTPGPNNLMAMGNAGRLGLKKSLRFCFGVFLGFLVVTSLSALFTALLANALPKVEPVLKWVGAAYILTLAWLIWRDKPKNSAAPRLEINSLKVAALLQFVNPKAILYSLTALSTFILPHYKSAPALTFFAFALAAVGFLGTVVWAAFGALIAPLFEKHRRPMNAFLAAALICCAASSVL